MNWGKWLAYCAQELLKMFETMLANNVSQRSLGKSFAVSQGRAILQIVDGTDDLSFLPPTELAPNTTSQTEHRLCGLSVEDQPVPSASRAPGSICCNSADAFPHNVPDFARGLGDFRFLAEPLAGGRWIISFYRSGPGNPRKFLHLPLFAHPSRCCSGCAINLRFRPVCER